MSSATAPQLTATNATDAKGPALPVADGLVELAGNPLPVRFYGRRPARGAVPLVLHLHGGQFVSGGLDTGGLIAKLLAEAGAVVASLAYPLAPAHPFPQAIEAAHATLDWLFKRRSKLAGPGAELWIAGEEAGGNLAAAVALMTRDQDHPPLVGQILLSPMLDTCVATASARDANAGPVGCRWADGWHHYLSRPADATHPYAAPGQAMRLAGLPPTLLVTARDDVLRDETQAFAQRLREAGVPVRDAVIVSATGWPCSLLCPEERSRDTAAPWADEVREQVRQFFAERAAAPA